MPVPPAVKITKHGVEFISKVDRPVPHIRTYQGQPSRTWEADQEARPGQDEKLRGLRRGKASSTQPVHWVRRRETDLQVGLKHDTW